jgi:hypothetical protein
MSKRYGALLAAMLLGLAAGSATARSERSTIERVGLLAK